MKMLVKCLGGSTAFGLNTPESDLDYRGVFVNTDPAKILGLEKFEHVDKREADDECYYEARKFFTLLSNGNTVAMEVLFTDNPLETSDTFKEIQKHRMSFVDTEKMLRCLLGYMQGERRLANGERVGVLGSKRKAQLEKYGFSPKNFVQLFRLAWAGEVLFQKGYFPINVKTEDPEFQTWLMSVKATPENHTKQELNLEVEKWEARLKKSYETRTFSSTFDYAMANEMLRQAYLPYLVK